jgi:hypothetical protein
MSKLQTVALWLIALLLAGQIGLEHIRPLIVLAANEEPFVEAARRCHEASSNYREVQSVAERDDSASANTLHRSATVGLMDCYESQNLRLAMLAGGVNNHLIDRLDLSARNASDASLHYFVKGLIDGL